MADDECTGKCVLVVEDNALNMKLFSAIAAAQGCGVLQANSGPRAIDLALQEQPDLIVMDVNLPGMSGLEATHILKSDDATRDIPVIVTTAYGMRGDDPEIRATGCDGFMAKPIGVSEFVALMRSLMGHAAREPRYVRHMIEASRGV
jgi:two-component system, cell cycle response regulator DivK